MISRWHTARLLFFAITMKDVSKEREENHKAQNRECGQVTLPYSCIQSQPQAHITALSVTFPPFPSSTDDAAFHSKEDFSIRKEKKQPSCLLQSNQRDTFSPLQISNPSHARLQSRWWEAWRWSKVRSAVELWPTTWRWKHHHLPSLLSRGLFLCSFFAMFNYCFQLQWLTG